MWEFEKKRRAIRENCNITSLVLQRSHFLVLDRTFAHLARCAAAILALTAADSFLRGERVAETVCVLWETRARPKLGIALFMLNKSRYENRQCDYLLG